MALDVNVRIVRDGIIINSSGNKPGGGEVISYSAVLGVAKLGQMKLGEK